jgi:glycosyltransferase involved in cell wall biosynthesis
VLTLVKNLRVLGHDVMVKKIPAMPSEDITIRVLSTFARDLLFSFCSAIEITSLIRKRGIHVLHVHDARIPLILGYFNHKVLKIPLVVTIHSPFAYTSRLNRLYKSANKVIVVSQDLKKSLEDYGVDETKLICIPNMVDTSDRLNSDCFDSARLDEDCSHKLVFVGRLDSSRVGILKILLKATPKILHELPSTQLWIVGNGPKHTEISRMVRDINERMEKQVVLLLGYRKDAARIIDAADIVIGAGRVALEAMAHRKPVIVGSSRTGSIFGGGLVTAENADEHKKYNFTGRNYAEQMDAQQMAELVVCLIRDEKWRKEVGEFGRDFVVRNCEAKRIVREIESIYIKCLKQDACAR